MKIQSEDSSIYQAISMREGNHIPKENKEIIASMRRENQVTKIPYQCPHHKSRYLN